MAHFELRTGTVHAGEALAVRGAGSVVMRVRQVLRADGSPVLPSETADGAGVGALVGVIRTVQGQRGVMRLWEARLDQLLGSAQGLRLLRELQRAHLTEWI